MVSRFRLLDEDDGGASGILNSKLEPDPELNPVVVLLMVLFIEEEVEFFSFFSFFLAGRIAGDLAASNILSSDLGDHVSENLSAAWKTAETSCFFSFRLSILAAIKLSGASSAQFDAFLAPPTREIRFFARKT